MITLTGDITDNFARAADAAFAALSLAGEAEVEVNFVTEEEIRELNARTRDTDRVTDVLSYPMLDEIRPFTRENYPFDVDPENGRVPLGSIVICRDVAARQAEEYGHSRDREETYLFVHGLLHLLGYDHMTEEDKSVMREAEERILSAIGQVR